MAGRQHLRIGEVRRNTHPVMGDTSALDNSQSNSAGSLGPDHCTSGPTSGALAASETRTRWALSVTAADVSLVAASGQIPMAADIFSEIGPEESRKEACERLGPRLGVKAVTLYVQLAEEGHGEAGWAGTSAGLH